MFRCSLPLLSFLIGEDFLGLYLSLYHRLNALNTMHFLYQVIVIKFPLFLGYVSSYEKKVIEFYIFCFVLN